MGRCEPYLGEKRTIKLPHVLPVGGDRGPEMLVIVDWAIDWAIAVSVDA